MAKQVNWEVSYQRPPHSSKKVVFTRKLDDAKLLDERSNNMLDFIDELPKDKELTDGRQKALFAIIRNLANEVNVNYAAYETLNGRIYDITNRHIYSRAAF